MFVHKETLSSTLLFPLFAFSTSRSSLLWSLHPLTQCRLPFYLNLSHMLRLLLSQSPALWHQFAFPNVSSLGTFNCLSCSFLFKNKTKNIHFYNLTTQPKISGLGRRPIMSHLGSANPTNPNFQVAPKILLNPIQPTCPYYIVKTELPPLLSC